MTIWQADFYRRPLENEDGQRLWELVVCTPDGNFVCDAQCPQSEANSDWLVTQFQAFSEGERPDLIQVFRPQALTLIATAAQKLGIRVEATRHTETLKQELRARAAQYGNFENHTGEAFDPVSLEKPPPQGLPEKLWGEQWRFATIAAPEIKLMRDRPIPILEMPEALMPMSLKLASTTKIPGIVIYGGKQSMRLARWLEQAKPVALNYIPTTAGVSGGLVLEAGLVDRWIVATFEDREVAKAAQLYEQRQQETEGLHFLLVQPDESGMTYSGFWLLREPF